MYEIIKEKLVTNMAEALCEKEASVTSFFQQGPAGLDNLQLLFHVFRHNDTTFEYIIRKMSPYVLQRGEDIVNKEEYIKDANLFMQNLLAFKAEIDHMVRYSFDNVMVFQKARDKDFTQFMNTQQFTPSYMALFADLQLRKDLKGKTDDEVHDILDSLIRLFCCLHGRDVFLKAYEKELAERLLDKSYLSMEYEEYLIGKLKVECGTNQVGKMVGMVKDITGSSEVQSEYFNAIQS